jgi:hypothetical protein
MNYNKNRTTTAGSEGDGREKQLRKGQSTMQGLERCVFLFFFFLYLLLVTALQEGLRIHKNHP